MMNIATKILANPTHVSHPTCENLRTLANMAIMTVAISEKYTVHIECKERALKAAETPIIPDAAVIT